MLRSMDHLPQPSLLCVPTNINTATYGVRAYSHASTKRWNALPDYMKSNK